MYTVHCACHVRLLVVIVGYCDLYETDRISIYHRPAVCIRVTGWVGDPVVKTIITWRICLMTSLWRHCRVIDLTLHVQVQPVGQLSLHLL